jgi:hypothetical protein
MIISNFTEACVGDTKKYPYVGMIKGRVEGYKLVLFSTKSAGTVIFNTSDPHECPIGIYINEWAEGNFEEVHGTVELKF